ncbi:hypothetical protein ElyMa_004852900 [Elysia marginata]|uniref:Fibronectin type III domain-containing protein n=1 Tax=Elysia marginata TaxID=1093978 RepID=A0AAV4INR2_9GAST|nr:hypothetical protein ElyMa_004852900 [Elysia marginata]
MIIITINEVDVVSVSLWLVGVLVASAVGIIFVRHKCKEESSNEAPFYNRNIMLRPRGFHERQEYVIQVGENGSEICEVANFTPLKNDDMGASNLQSPVPEEPTEQHSAPNNDIDLMGITLPRMTAAVSFHRVLNGVGTETHV